MIRSGQSPRSLKGKSSCHMVSETSTAAPTGMQNLDLSETNISYRKYLIDRGMLLAPQTTDSNELQQTQRVLALTLAYLLLRQ